MVNDLDLIAARMRHVVETTGHSATEDIAPEVRLILRRHQTPGWLQLAAAIEGRRAGAVEVAALCRAFEIPAGATVRHYHIRGRGVVTLAWAVVVQGELAVEQSTRRTPGQVQTGCRRNKQ